MMSITIQEDWSSYAAGTEVQNISGWTGSGTFPADAAGQKVNATSQLENTSSNGCLVFYDAGSPSHYCEVNTVAISSGSYFESYGPAVRCIDQENFIATRQKADQLQIVTRSGGTTYNVLQNIAGSFLTTDTIKLELDGNTLKVYQNAVQIGVDEDVTGIHSGNNAGLWAHKAANPTFGDLEIGTLSSDTIAIDPYEERKVFPVFGTTRSHTISGTFAGATTPTAIEYRVEEFVGGATVIDWAILDASPSANAYTGVVNMPKGNFYKILTRFSNSVGTVASTNRIGFGILAEFGGQSNTAALFGTGNSTTPNDNTAIFDGSSTWDIPNLQIVTEALNAIAVSNSCVVGCYSTAVGSTKITQHLTGGSNYAARQAALTAAGGELNLLWWGQGEGDTGSGTDYNAYQANLSALYQDILTRTGQDTSTLSMTIVQLGRNEGQSGNDVGWQAVRAAQTNYASLTANVSISHQTMDLPMSDTLHRNDSGSIQECLRFADTFNAVYQGSGDTGQGVIPTSAVVSGADVEITHNLNGSSLITLPVNAKDQYEVSDDDFSTLLTINSIATDTNKITLTTSAPITGEVKIRSQQGQDPDHTKMPTGDKLYNGQAVMVESIVTELESAAVIPVIINLTATGYPDGTYSAEFWNDSTNPMTRIKVENVTFSSGASSSVMTGLVDVGVTVYTRIDGASPPETGVTCYGVTE